MREGWCSTLPLRYTLASVLARPVAFLGVLSLVACGPSEETKVFLGPIQAPSFQAPSPSPPGTPPCAEPEPPALAPLTAVPCAEPIPGELPAGLAPAPGSLLLADRGGLRTLGLDPSGCPSTPTTFTLPVSGLTGVVARADRLWLAQAEAVQVWKEDALETSCGLAGVRSLAASGAGAWAVTGGGVRRLEVNDGVCSAGEPWSLPGAALVGAASGDDGVWIALTQPGTCGAAPAVNRYTAQGELDEGAPVFEAARLGLCTVTAMSESQGKLMLLDGTCGRGALVDAITGKTEGSWQTPPGQTPVGVIPAPGGSLVGTASGAGSSALLRFVRVSF